MEIFIFTVVENIMIFLLVCVCKNISNLDNRQKKKKDLHLQLQQQKEEIMKIFDNRQIIIIIK
mgnify:CR=1 FL=1